MRCENILMCLVTKLLCQNIINAIQHSSVLILDYLLLRYDQVLPPYLMKLFSFDSYVVDKIEKISCLDQVRIQYETRLR